MIHPSSKLSDIKLTSLPQLFEVTGFKAKAGSYLQWRKTFPMLGRGTFSERFLIAERNDAPFVTSYVIADFDTEDGLDLLREAVESLVFTFSA